MVSDNLNKKAVLRKKTVRCRV